MASLQVLRKVASVIQKETGEGGYLAHWDESKELLSKEQQTSYFAGLAKMIVRIVEG